MKGSIRKRGASSWELTIDLAYDAQGRRQRKFVTVRGTKRQGNAKLREFLAEHDKGKPLETSNRMVRQFIARWLQEYVAVQVKASTATHYEQTMRSHILPALGEIPLAKLQPQDTSAMLGAARQKGLADSTVRLVYIINEALNCAVKWGILYRNPATLLDPPRVPRHSIKAMDLEQARAFLAATKGSPYEALFHFIAYTGCRRGEALALRWQDIDMQNGLISFVQNVYRVGRRGLIVQPVKTNASAASLDMDEELASLLRAHRIQQLEHRLRVGDAYDDHDLVFSNDLGGYRDPPSVSQAFARFARRAGVEGFTLHGLRHFRAAVLIKAGLHPKIIQERLRHDNIGITLDIYGHLMPGLQKEAAKAFTAIMREAGVVHSGTS